MSLLSVCSTDFNKVSQFEYVIYCWAGLLHKYHALISVIIMLMKQNGNPLTVLWTTETLVAPFWSYLAKWWNETYFLSTMITFYIIPLYAIGWIFINKFHFIEFEKFHGILTSLGGIRGLLLPYIRNQASPFAIFHPPSMLTANLSCSMDIYGCVGTESPLDI